MSQQKRDVIAIAAPAAGGAIGIVVGALVAVTVRDYRAIWFVYGLSGGLFIGVLGAYLRFVWPEERQVHS